MEPVRDGRGVALTAPVGGFLRIASTSVLADQLLAELSEPERIVAASRYSTGPFAHRLGAVPRLEGIGDVERLIALSPDVVLMSTFAGDAERVRRLEEAGLTLFDLGEARGVDSTLRAIGDIGALLDCRERADRLSASFSRRLAHVAADLPAGTPRRAGMYLAVIADQLFGGTTGTSYHDVLIHAGIDDCAAERYRGWPQYAAEQLLALDPPLIVTKSGMAQTLRRHPWLAGLRACRDPGGIIEIDADLIEDPGLGVLNAAEALNDAAYPVFGIFSGSSPCDGRIRGLVGIGSDARAELMNWNLVLHADAETHAPSTYDLHCAYGMTEAGKPGLAKEMKSLDRHGSWTIGAGSASDPQAVVYELSGTVSLLRVGAGILHVLNPDRSLMSGNGGWSYTLNRLEASEPLVDAALAMSQPDMSYQVAPLSSGPSVFGIFQGRTPCHGIARQLDIEAHPGSNRVKWMVTLYQDPRSKAPTTYKIEYSLQRIGSRTGGWSIIPGAAGGGNPTVYRLDHETEPAIHLLKGDDNVLFLLDRDQRPLVGNAAFSYTLDRRKPLLPW
jgi:iron complex transport system substrate-binding protein